MGTFLAVYYWVKLALLALTVVLVLASAWRTTGRRRLVVWREATQAVLAIAVFAGSLWFAEPAVGAVWAAVAGVAGLGLGFLVGRRAERFETAQGGPGIRRAPLAPWAWAVAMILVSVTLLFGSSYLFALAMIVLAFATGAVTGQIAGELSGARATPEPRPA